MDDDLSIKIVEKSLITISKILINCHSCNRPKLKWDDQNSNKNEDLILDLENHCFRLLRYLFNVKKNKNLFKILFPSKIFVNFIDIGNFVKEVEKYRFLSNAFNQLTGKIFLFMIFNFNKAQEIDNIEKHIESIALPKQIFFKENNFIKGYQLIDLIVF